MKPQIILQVEEDDILERVRKIVGDESLDPVIDDFVKLLTDDLGKRIKDEFQNYFYFNRFSEIWNEILDEFANELLDNSHLI